MRSRTKLIGAGVAVVGVAVVTTGAVVVAGSDDTDTPITGTALDTASRAALDHLGGGRVTGTEVDDEDSYYEVEVTLDDGRQVDVQLDESFAVVETMADRDTAADTDG